MVDTRKSTPFCLTIMKLWNISPADHISCYLLRLDKSCILIDCPIDMNTLLLHAPIASPNWISRANLHHEKRKRHHSEDSASSDNKKPKLDSNSDSTYQFDPSLDFNNFSTETPTVSIPFFDNINLTQVDAVIISNYQNILALPYLTERDDFDAAIYATEPTIQLGKLLMEELVESFERNIRYKNNLPNLGSKSSNNYDFYQNVSKNSENNNPLETEGWSNIDQSHTAYNDNCSKFSSTYQNSNKKILYNKTAIATALNNVHSISYGEHIDIHGEIKLTAFSTGFTVGSANWLIKSVTTDESVLYVNSSSTLRVVLRHALEI